MLTKLHPSHLPDPPVARFLFADKRSALLWLVLRIYVGWSFLEAGLHKITDPAWMVSGEAIQAFWKRAVLVPVAPAKPAITYDWYRSFLQMLLDLNAHPWFAKVIVFAEIAIGIGLILGLLVGVASVGGAFMNWNFLMAGTVSVNPVLLPLAMLLVLAWKNAGYLGLDRFVLPALGTPWAPGRFFKEEKRVPSPVPIRS